MSMSKYILFNGHRIFPTFLFYIFFYEFVLLMSKKKYSKFNVVFRDVTDT